MYHFKIIYIFLFFFLNPLSLFSTTYENASDKKIDGWHVSKYFSKGVVKNIYDKKKRSRVIKLDGNATRTIYMLLPKKKIFKRKKEENLFGWEMNFSEDFVIMIGINTIKGKRFLIYTSGNNNSYLQYGLGSDSSSGQWKKYRRNLQKDLAKSDRDNKFLNITSFVVKGSGMVDNIKILKFKETFQEPKLPYTAPLSSSISIKKPKPISKILVEEKPKIEKKKSKDSNTSTPPTISIKGTNPMILKKGEPYIELGATAKNRDGSLVMVTISDDIDILKEGEYSVIYMATNSFGDSVIDRRRVVVGKVREEKESRKSVASKNNSRIEESLDEDAIDLEQRAFEMLEWEKELAFREKELLEEKNRKDVNSPNMNYPSRPGL